MTAPVIVWLRRDLRLADQPAFHAAADYIREWVPELAGLPDAEIHDPADARRGGCPEKIIGHREGRERVLEAYRRMKSSG